MSAQVSLNLSNKFGKSNGMQGWLSIYQFFAASWLNSNKKSTHARFISLYDVKIVSIAF